MKNVSLLILTLFYLNVHAQNYCATPGNLPNTLSAQQSAVARNSASCPTFVRVFFHIVCNTNGSGGQSPSVVSEIMNNLSAVYNPHQIYFSNAGFDSINDDYLGSGWSAASNDPRFATLVGTNTQANAIDVYLLNNSNWNQGRATGIPSKALVIGGALFGVNLVTSNVLCHEMGHCLGLFHTHHNNCFEGNCDETPNGANQSPNCTTCGDFVCDTPADPNINFDVNASCQWGGVIPTNPNNPNCATTPGTYAPLVSNVMSYARPSCLQNFTGGQGDRMRATIAAGGVLQPVAGTGPGQIRGTYSHGGNTYNVTGSSGISVSNAGNNIFFNLTNTWDPNAQYSWNVSNTNGNVSHNLSSSPTGYITLGGGAYATVTCTVTTPCGTLSITFNCYNYSGGGFRMAAYPNPANEQINVAATKTKDGQENKDIQDEGMAADKPVEDSDLIDIDAGVQLLDKNNRVVQEGRLNKGKLSLSVSKLPDGTYFLHMTFEDRQIRKQIIIQH